MPNKTFNFFIQMIPCSFNFTGKTVPFPSTDITRFLCFSCTQKGIIFLFSFAHFSNKIVKPKCKAPLSKLLKSYICYKVLI